MDEPLEVNEWVICTENGWAPRVGLLGRVISSAGGSAHVEVVGPPVGYAIETRFSCKRVNSRWVRRPNIGERLKYGL